VSDKEAIKLRDCHTTQTDVVLATRAAGGTGDASHNANVVNQVTRPAITTWILGDSSTKVSFSGFFKLTGICDISGSTGLGGDSSSGSGRNYLTARTLGLNDDITPPARDVYFHVRESRFTVTTSSPTNIGDIDTCLEVDFLGDPTASAAITNSYLPRLRKAYAKLSGFTIGQDRSAFSNFPYSPETVDRNGPVVACQIRQPLIKYSRTLAIGGIEGFSFDVSIENPESEFITTDGVSSATGSSGKGSEYRGTCNIKGENKIPDFIFGIQHCVDSGFSALSILIRENCIYERDTRRRESKFGGAIIASAMQKVFGSDQAFLSVAYGEGCGRYFTDAVNTSTYYDGNKLHNQKEFGINIAYKHQWDKKYNIRSNIVFGYGRFINCKSFRNNYNAGIINRTRASEINRRVQSIHISLIGNITENIQVGAEYIVASRKAETDKSGTLHRLTFAAQINF
jgi:hypothetical protein